MTTSGHAPHVQDSRYLSPPGSAPGVHVVPRAAGHLVQRCYLLREDPDLLDLVPSAQRDRAIEHCVTRTVTLDSGKLDGSELPPARPGSVGLLVLDGLLLRRVQTAGRAGAELLGQGDLLQPDHLWAASTSLEHTTEWQALERPRLAILDGGATRRLALYPTLIGAVTARALDRARSLALVMAILHQPRIETRLHMLLWHLADRWGRVGRDGVLLPLRLSHSLLADLVCARRPSVTVALQSLTKSGLLKRVEQGWLLYGDPTIHKQALDDSSRQAAAQPG